MFSQNSTRRLPYQDMDPDSLQDLVDSCQGWHDPDTREYKAAFIGEQMRRLFGIYGIEATVPRLDEMWHRPTQVRCLSTPMLEDIIASNMDNTDPLSLHIIEDCLGEHTRRLHPDRPAFKVRWRVKVKFAPLSPRQ